MLFVRLKQKMELFEGDYAIQNVDHNFIKWLKG